jgi:hypothetical protein
MLPPKDSANGLQAPTRSTPSSSRVAHPTSLPVPPTPDIHALWRPLPPGAIPSPRSHIPTDEEIIAAIAFVWCIHWNSFSTMDPRGLCARIIAKRPSWNLLEKRVGDVRGRALADGRLRRPDFEAGLRMRPSIEEVRLREYAYDFEPRWRSARPAQAGKLTRSFEITSGTSSDVITVSRPCLLGNERSLMAVQTGEVVWGQLGALVSGMKSGMRDKENLASPHRSSSSPPWRFRAAARPGTWHVRRHPPISRYL